MQKFVIVIVFLILSANLAISGQDSAKVRQLQLGFSPYTPNIGYYTNGLNLQYEVKRYKNTWNALGILAQFNTESYQNGALDIKPHDTSFKVISSFSRATMLLPHIARFYSRELNPFLIFRWGFQVGIPMQVSYGSYFTDIYRTDFVHSTIRSNYESKRIGLSTGTSVGLRMQIARRIFLGYSLNACIMYVLEKRTSHSRYSNGIFLNASNRMEYYGDGFVRHEFSLAYQFRYK